MKTYVITSGSIFGLIVVAHLLRIAAEGPRVVRDPSFLFFTVAAAALSLWAWRVLRVLTKEGSS